MSALKTILIFLAGTVVGAGLLFGYLQYYTQRQFALLEEEINSNIPTPAPNAGTQVTPESFDETEPTTTSPTPAPNPNLQEQFQVPERTVRTSVAEVVPGLGFIAQDSSGTRIFVAWQQTPPDVGQRVTVAGELQPFNQSLGIAGQQALPQSVQQVLTQTPYYIQATQVTQTM